MTPPNKDYDNALNNAESQDSSMSGGQQPEQKAAQQPESDAADDSPYASEDKYLALEQEGVRYTGDADPMANNPDHLTFRDEPSRNAQAFDQDEAVMRTNVDLDEHQSRSISSEEDIDTNTTDEVL